MSSVLLVLAVGCNEDAVLNDLSPPRDAVVALGDLGEALDSAATIVDMAMSQQVEPADFAVSAPASLSFAWSLHTVVGERPIGLAIADLDRDGKLDIAVADFGNGNQRIQAADGGVRLIRPDGDVAVLLGRGDGTFAPVVKYAAGKRPAGIVAADLDGDGKLDVAAATAGDQVTMTPGAIEILLGLGDGTFKAAVEYPHPGRHSGLGVGDFDRDGHFDLVTSDGGQLTLLPGRGDGTFPTSSQVLQFGFDLIQPLVTDFDKDGRADVAVLDRGGDQVVVARGRGDGTFLAPFFASLSVMGKRALPGWLAAGDLDGDTRLDLVTANHDTSSVSTLLGKGDGTFAAPQQRAAGAGTDLEGVALADFDGDGRLDAASSYWGRYLVFVGNGDGSLQPPASYPTRGSANGAVGTGDFNGDGKPDLVVGDGDEVGSIFVILNSRQ